MPPPPPPPPAPVPGPPPPPSLGGGSKGGGTPNRSALLDQIHQGARLKKAVTNDRSAPQVGAVKSNGGGHGSSGGGGGSGGGGPAALGGLFAGVVVPKLKSVGQARVPGAATGPALKPPSSMPNGPTYDDENRQLDGRLPPPPPSSASKPSGNRGPPAPPSSLSKPNNGGSPLIPSSSKPNNGDPPFIPSNSKLGSAGTPGRLNLNAFKQMNDSGTNENNSSDTPQSSVSLIAGGLASNRTQNQSPVHKPPMPTGGPPASSPVPPPPPSRPPPLNADRPSNVMGRPLPPPPGDSGNVTVSPSRVPPPPPSRIPAPPPSANRTAAPPLPPPPPQRTTSNVNAGGTIVQPVPPSIRPPTHQGLTSSGFPAPPQIQPPSNFKKSGNEDDFELRFRFHQLGELALPEPFTNINKVYQSKRNTALQRPPPPHPPWTSV